MTVPLAVRETLRFLERHLPPAPARILEVGAGPERMERALSERGFDAVAIEESELPHHPANASYDAVVFADALHLMQPIDRALDHACRVLRGGGILLAEEIAFDRVNVHTARWFYDLESVLAAADLIQQPDPRHAAEHRPLARWRLEHASDPPLASGHDMLAAARERLELLSVEEAPHLYRELASRARANAAVPRVLEVVFDLESRLVRERDIAAAGLRFVGRPLV